MQVPEILAPAGDDDSLAALQAQFVVCRSDKVRPELRDAARFAELQNDNPAGFAVFRVLAK